MQAFTYALYMLASHSEYAQPLRNEIETVLSTEPMSKQAVDKFEKLDSFMRESQRLCNAGGFWVHRKALKDFVFSDGTVVPAGTIMSLLAFHVHHDPDNFEDPEDFKPFRFYDLHRKTGEDLRFTVPTSDFLLFGTGKPKCPGRFFAVSELKTMMAHVLLNYDVKLPGETPRSRWIGYNIIPDTSAEMLFRRRQL